MKTTKILSKVNILSSFLGVFLFISLFSCDDLEPDVDALNPDVKITGDEIYVRSNSSTFIDLKTQIQTTQRVKLAVTSQTSSGSLSDLGQGLLEYFPTVGKKDGRDAFEFTVYSEQNEIIEKDTVVIIIENDSTNLPCGIFPSNDYVYNAKKEFISTINVLQNDLFCGIDTTDLVLSIHRPDSNFFPRYGSASVKGLSVEYTLDNTFNGSDKIIYRLSSRNQPSSYGYGIIYISSNAPCNPDLKNDIYQVSVDSAGQTLVLPVLKNDTLCGSNGNYQINISQAPNFGHANATPNGITYTVPSNISSSFHDTFVYEICLNAFCKTARVDVYAKSDSSCVVEALDDLVSTTFSGDTTFYVDVLRNDTTCGDLTNLSIVSPPKKGNASVQNKLIAYTLDSSYQGSDSLRYKICNTGGCSSASVLIRRN